MIKLWKHLKTITKHKLLVMRLCFRFELYKQGFKHDLSKYSWVELKTGMKYYDGTRSPNGIERQTIGYSEAWLHHKGRNKHHWEYWVDFGRNGTYAAKMPTRYVVEMFCDRVAATMVYNGKEYNATLPLDYYRKTHHYYVIHEETDAMIYDMLEHLANYGLDQTITYIKQTYLNKENRKDKN